MADRFYARHAKRGLDIAAATVLLAALAPFLALTALATRLALGPGVLFRQERAGRQGQPFTLLKLRSMRAPLYPSEPDAARLTRFGRLLRASALDEAPQLINVLRGEMSLVGPRPLPLAYIPRYTPRQATRLRVRPGLAGLAQARGRNAVPWDARLEWDARYAEAVSLQQDLAAVLGTLRVLLSGHGVTAPGHATMPELSQAGAAVAAQGVTIPDHESGDPDNFIPEVAFPLADSPKAASTSR